MSGHSGTFVEYAMIITLLLLPLSADGYEYALAPVSTLQVVKAGLCYDHNNVNRNKFNSSILHGLRCLKM